VDKGFFVRTLKNIKWGRPGDARLYSICAGLLQVAKGHPYRRLQMGHASADDGIPQSFVSQMPAISA